MGVFLENATILAVLEEEQKEHNPDAKYHTHVLWMTLNVLWHIGSYKWVPSRRQAHGFPLMQAGTRLLQIVDRVP